MAELNMIDTMGYGIHEMYAGQARRYFPLPDYDLSEDGVVKITIHGQIVDPAYSRALIQRTDLSLENILALDRVQKKLPVDDGALKILRRAKLIEGRKPNFHVSASVAAATETQVEYIRNRGRDDEFYLKMIRDYLAEFNTATREEINRLLWDKLSDTLDDHRKTVKINNLIAKMRKTGTIRNTGLRRAPVWKATK